MTREEILAILLANGRDCWFDPEDAQEIASELAEALGADTETDALPSDQQVCPLCFKIVAWDAEHMPHAWRHLANDSRWCELDDTPWVLTPVMANGSSNRQRPAGDRVPKLTNPDLWV